MCALMEAENAPSVAMVALPLAVKKSTGPNGVLLKEPVAFRTSPTSLSVLIGVPVAENDPDGPNGACSVREAENPPSAEGLVLPLADNHVTVRHFPAGHRAARHQNEQAREPAGGTRPCGQLTTDRRVRLALMQDSV